MELQGPKKASKEGNKCTFWPKGFGPALISFFNFVLIFYSFLLLFLLFFPKCVFEGHVQVQLSGDSPKACTFNSQAAASY